jgi:hypothetical protein
MSLWVSGLLLAALATPGNTLDAEVEFSCAAVALTILDDPGWHSYSFVHPDSGEPIHVKIFADEIQAKNTVFVLRTGRWVELNHGDERVGSRLRIQRGTMARVVISYEDCLEIIEPKDK